MVFANEKFRELAKWDTQSDVERDRIFNELVATAVIYLMLLIDGSLDQIRPGRQHFWRDLRALVPETFVGWLRNLGIAAEHADIWRKLLDLRLREYVEGQKETRQAWTRVFADHPDKDVLNDAAVRLETLTVGTLLHITRGNAPTNPADPLRRHLRTWLSTLEAKLGKRVGW